jgi:hypothetical protein
MVPNYVTRCHNAVPLSATLGESDDESSANELVIYLNGDGK